MRVLRLLTLGLVVVMSVLLSTGCGTTTVKESPAPTADDIKVAQEYLAKTKESDGKQENGDVWARAVVVSTRYESTPGNGSSWNMTAVVKSDGTTKTFNDSAMAIVDDLEASISPGDYVVYKDDGDEYLRENEIKVVKKVAVDIMGK